MHAIATRKLLIVDDDDADMIMFLRCKDQAGLELEVQRARNAAEAVEILRLQHLEGRGRDVLVLLDLNMPCMTGIEFLADLRADPELCDTVVIAVSGAHDPQQIDAAYAHHVAGLVVKTNGSTDRLVRLVGAYFDAVTLPTS